MLLRRLESINLSYIAPYLAKIIVLLRTLPIEVTFKPNILYIYSNEVVIIFFINYIYPLILSKNPSIISIQNA